MKNLKRTIWGIILVLAAIIIALNSFNIIDFDLFFDGWWTLFIIVPSFVGLIENKNKGGNGGNGGSFNGNPNMNGGNGGNGGGNYNRGGGGSYNRGDGGKFW